MEYFVQHMQFAPKHRGSFHDDRLENAAGSRNEIKNI